MAKSIFQQKREDELKKKVESGQKVTLEKPKKMSASAEEQWSENAYNIGKASGGQVATASYRKNQAAQSESDSQKKKWYKGEKPTETETLARIATLGQQSDSYGRKLYADYERAKQEGHWAETYDKATSPYLAALGIEDPSQINDEFFAANAHLYQQGIHTSTGALSSAKKNGPGAMLAYNLSGLHADYNATKELKAEQDQMVREAQYWMSKGLSDDEIKAKLNIGGEGSKYKKIGSALDAAKVGKFTPTTDKLWAATSWGVDGMLWALRNPEQSTGDYFHDAIQKDMGRGKVYAVDPVAAAKRDRTSPAWSPYENGTTMDETAITLGVNGAEGFLRDDSWWEQKRLEVLASGDPKAESAYADAWKAEQKTRAVEDELPAFFQDIELRMEAGLSLDEVFEATFEAYPEIKDLYDGYMAISPVELTRGVGIDFGTLRGQIIANYELKQAQKNAPHDPAAMQMAVDAEKQAQIDENGSLIDTDTIPTSLTSKNTSVYTQTAQKNFLQGMLWASAPSATDVVPTAKQIDYLQDVDNAPQSAPYQLAGAYAEWTDDQKYAAQNYISDSRGGHDTSDAVQEMKDAGLTDEQINTFRSQMTDALGSGDYTDELMDAWFEPVEAPPESYTYAEINTAIQSGNLPAALDMMEVNFDKKVAEDPELLNTENAAKASVAMLGLAAESGVLSDPEQQEQATAIADAVVASMGMAEDGGFYLWLDNVLNYNGALVEAAQNNPGWGLNNTLMWAMDHTADTVTDLANKFVGYTLNGIGRIVGSENLAQKGEDIANELTARVADHSDLLLQNGTPLEIIGGQGLSEIAKMTSFSKASQFLNAGTAIAFGEKFKWLTRMISSTPFALESGIREFDQAYGETEGNYLTSLLSGMAGFGATALMSRFDGILKNIEAQGMPFISEVVDSLSTVPGSGAKATIARWGKAGGMWLWNLVKTGVNEAVQEPAENIVTTFLTDLVKGENPLDRDWEAYGKELVADAAMAFLISTGSSVATMPTYANSAMVVEAQMGKTELTPQDVEQFIAALQEDANNPQIQEEATRRAKDIAVEVKTGELIAQGTAPKVDGSKEQEATKTAAKATVALENATREVQLAVQKVNANPSDTQAANAAVQKVRMHKAAVQAAESARSALQEAQAEVQAQRKSGMDAVRVQAAAEVEQAYAGLEKQKAETQRQGGSVDPDSFIQPTPDHTPEQKAEIQAYHNATNSKMLEAAEMYKDNPGAKNKRVLLSEVGEREGADIQQILGLNVEGYTHTADRSFFTHVEKRHGEHGEADQSMRSLNDVARVGWVLENYDSVERVYNSDGSPATADGYLDKDGKHMPLLKYIKKLDGTVYVVEAAGDNNWKRLWLVSAYMQKNSPVNNSQSATVTQTPYAEDQPLGNVRNANASPVTSIIADSEPTVNSQSSEISRTQVPPQTVQTNSQAMTRKVVNPIQSARTLSSAIGIGERIGTRKMNNQPQAVLGYYNNRSQYLAVRSREASNISVSFHEIGHAISQRTGLTGTQNMIANLPQAFAQNYSRAELPGEAFAEFVWRYMVDDQQAEAFAGAGFIRQFEQQIRNAGIADAVHTARDEMHAFVNSSVNDRIGAMVVDRSQSEKSTVREWFTKQMASLVDSTAPLEQINSAVRERNDGDLDAADNLRNAALLRNTADRRAWNLLTGDFTDSNWTVTGEGLSTVIERTGMNGRDFDLLNNYMLALHSLDRDAQNLPVFDTSLTTAQRKQFISEVQRNHPEVAQAASAIHDWWHNFMQTFMVNTGYLTQDALDTFERMYPHYVPTNRVKKQGAGRRTEGGSTYTVRRATGSTEEIYNPMDSIVQNVNTIVKMVSQNNVGLVWDNLFRQYDGLGVFARNVTQDMQQETVNTEALRDQVDEILTNASTDQDVIDLVLDAIGTEQSQWRATGDVNLPNVLQVRRADGTRVFYEFSDNEIFKAITGLNERSATSVADWMGRITRGMAALTTGSNPMFSIRNFARDFQKSVNYGSWASNYTSGAAKWLRAAYDVWRENGEYNDYKALGGGGWTRIDPQSRKGSDEYRGELFRGYNTSNVGRTAKWAGRKLWNAVTLSRLNEIVEQTSRYAEYKFGKQDKATAAGRQQAFLNAQEATVDFSRTGNSQVAHDLKQIIPFFNASEQGVYQTAREFLSESERGRLPVRFAKTVVNTALASALASVMLLRNLGEDEKEEFDWLSDDLKAEHIYLPNPFGDTPLLRIPIVQDPLARAVHAFVTNAIWYGESDDVVIDTAVVAQNILDGFNPVGGTIFDAANAVNTNTNWYGSRIVPTRMDGWDPTTQYTEETADLFISTSRMLSGVGVKVSPMMLQYLAEQYTGFVGQMVIPAISKDPHTGEAMGVSAVIDNARKKLTSDPLVSNGITSAFYDTSAILDQVVAASKNNRPANMLRRGLTEEETTAAADEAKEMLSSNGVVGSTKKLISEAYTRIEEIDADTSLTDREKYQLTCQVRREMLERVLDANEALGAYTEKYVTGGNILSRFFEGSSIRQSTTYEKLPQAFRDDFDAGDEYMTRSKEVWDATGKDSALPKVNLSFSADGTDYSVAPEYIERYTLEYQISYEVAVDNINNWDELTDDERLEELSKAHRKAHDRAKSWYLKKVR